MTISQALVTIAVALISGGFLFLGSWHAGRRDDKRWEREHAAERERYSRELAKGWAEERRNAYLGFSSSLRQSIAEMSGLLDYIEREPSLDGEFARVVMTATLGAVERSFNRVSDVDLYCTADAARIAGEALLVLAGAMQYLGRIVRTPEGISLLHESLTSDMASLFGIAERFRTQARKDLGIPEK